MTLPYNKAPSRVSWRGRDRALKALEAGRLAINFPALSATLTLDDGLNFRNFDTNALASHQDAVNIEVFNDVAYGYRHSYRAVPLDVVRRAR